MSEAKINVATGFNGGMSVSLRADSLEEFQALSKQLYGDAAGELFAQGVLEGLLSSVPVAAAAASVNAQLGPVANVYPITGQVSTVGQPLPQPTAQPAAVAAVPPLTNYPGDCAHGPRVYKDSMSSRGQWRRWDCSVPYTKGVTGRCASVNV